MIRQRRQRKITPTNSKQIKDQYLDQIKQKSESMFEELIVDGKSFITKSHDLCQLARMALQQAFGVSSSGNIWASLLDLQWQL